MKKDSPNTPFPIRKYYGVMIVGFALFLAVMAYYSVKFKEKRNLAKQEVKLNESVVNTATQKTTATSETTTQATTEEATNTMSKTVLTYNGTTKLSWPLTGNVLMPYSMGNTIYFESLDQYRTNPGILIEAKVGSQVKAVKDAVVDDVQKTAEYGETVTLDLGDNYSAMYGQLKNVSVKIGQTIKAGEVIGQVNTPTDYYILEGANLFFEMMKDKKPINPTKYLK